MKKDLNITAEDIFTRTFIIKASTFILLLLSFLFCGILIGQEHSVSLAKNYIYDTLSEHCPEVLMSEGTVVPDDKYINLIFQKQMNKSQVNKTEYGWEVK